MEKTCEFCKALNPAVYCKADAARLCLSCDAKVHSANALSSRHPRTVVCESCRNRPAHIRCFDHQIFLCYGCEKSLHDANSKHQRCSIDSYTGCPSAKDFVTLWGLNLNDLRKQSRIDHFVSTSSMSMEPDMQNLDIPRHCSLHIQGSSLACEVNYMISNMKAESEILSSIEHSKKGQQSESTFILHQILELERLQLSEGCSALSLRFEHDPLRRGSIFLEREGPQQEQEQGPFPLSPSELEQLTSSSNAGNPFHGDSFWHGKSPVQSNQLWSQNMQELGVCQEVGGLDDFKFPEVDLTFRNFEELFGEEHDQAKMLIWSDDLTCSSMERDTSPDKFDNGCTEATKPSCNSADAESMSFAAEETITKRYNQEKKVQRSKKPEQHASPKAKARGRKRVGRRAKAMSM